MQEEHILEKAETQVEKLEVKWEEWKRRLWERALECVEDECGRRNLSVPRRVIDDDYSEGFKRTTQGLGEWTNSLYSFTRTTETQKRMDLENMCKRIMHVAESQVQLITEIHSDETNSAAEDYQSSEGEDYEYESPSSEPDEEMDSSISSDEDSV